MENSEIVNELDERQADIAIQIKRLQNDMDAIQRTKEIFVDRSKDQIEMKDIIETPSNEKIKPTQAIRQIFVTYPDRKWFPGQIRDRLETMRDANKLESNYQNLLFAVHSILSGMVKREEIEKSKPDKNRRCYYTKVI